MRPTTYVVYDIETVTNESMFESPYPATGPRGGKSLHQGNQVPVAVGLSLFDSFSELPNRHPELNDSLVLTGDNLAEQLNDYWLNEFNEYEYIVLIGWNSDQYDEAILQSFMVRSGCGPLRRGKTLDLKNNPMCRGLWTLPRATLTSTCEVYGLKNEDRFTGADVPQLWAEGRIDDIVEHCKYDVMKTTYLAGIVAGITNF